jgi:hypothetical protein
MDITSKKQETEYHINQKLFDDFDRFMLQINGAVDKLKSEKY